MKFRKDVVIDLVCYRRHGHNEADEPAATQPLMYQAIRKHATARQIYGQRLEQDGLLAEGQAATMLEDYRRGLEEDRPQARAFAGTSGNKFTVDWSRHIDADASEKVVTAVERKRMDALAKTLTQPPAGFTLHPRVARIIDDRARMYADELPLDWGAAETMAYATLLTDGYDIRLTGQDTARGTFFHRHAVLHDQATGRTDTPLARVAKDKVRFRVIDSTLSEEAVLGFEYGYSTTDPSTLVIWEGQFGDFVNGAQVIIDQFITSGEAKWGRVSGITLFLPHGYEGQGPEHSSARLERFLQLSAELNHQVCVPSTPAQMFHMLRRQMLRALRKPLIVMTPKSLLRHKLSRFHDGRPQRGPLPAGHRRGRPDRCRQGAAHRLLQRQGVLRPARAAPRLEGRRGRAGAHRGALPVPGGRVPGDPRPLRGRARGRLVPGRTAEPGRLVPDPPPPAGAARRPARACTMPAARAPLRRPPACTPITSASRKRSSPKP